MAKDMMTDAQLRRRRKAQGHIGRTTSTLGLTGAGLAAGGLLVAKKPGALRVVQKIPGAGKKLAGTPEEAGAKLKNAAVYTGIASGGIGGVGGFNAASIYSDEARRKKQTTLKKGLDMDDKPLEMGYYGESGKPLTHREIEAEIEKAWTPSASNFDSERSRKKRADTYSTGAVAVGGAGGAYGARHGFKAIQAGRKIKSETMAPMTTRPARADVPGVPGTPAQRKKPPSKANPKGVPRVEAVDPIPGIPGRKAKMVGDAKKATNAIRTSHLRPVAVHGGKAALGAAVAGGAVATGAHLKRKKESGWQAYEKRDTTSAFGVDHIEKAFAPGKALKAFKGARKVQPAKTFEDPFAPGGPFHGGKAAKESTLPKRAANSAPKKTAAQLNVPAGLKPANYRVPRQPDLG